MSRASALSPLRTSVLSAADDGLPLAVGDRRDFHADTDLLCVTLRHGDADDFVWFRVSG